MSSSGDGPDWGQTRSWTNAIGYSTGGVNGSGWVDSQMPHLVEENGTSTLAVVADAQTVYFFGQTGSSYQEQFGETEQLTYNSSSDTYTFIDGSGINSLRRVYFRWSPARQGQFASMTMPGGTDVAVTSWTSSGNIAEVQATANGITDSYLYSYLTSGVNTGLLSTVTLLVARRRQYLEYRPVRRVHLL